MPSLGNSNEIEPNLTFKIDWENGRIRGRLDDPLEAVKQAVELILSIPRLEHLIYSLDYGHELNHLIGKEQEYVDGSIRKMIEECLMVDDRVTKVDDFTFKKVNEFIEFEFNVFTIYGDFVARKELNIHGV